MKTKILLTALLLIVCVITANSQERIKFKKGETYTMVSNGIARGESYTYVVGASKGQFMTITIMSPEDNAEFFILNTKTWQFMEGATEDNPAKRWEGTLPASTDYQIVVGSSRGGSEFTLQVVIE